MPISCDFPSGIETALSCVAETVAIVAVADLLDDWEIPQLIQDKFQTSECESITEQAQMLYGAFAGCIQREALEYTYDLSYNLSDQYMQEAEKIFEAQKELRQKDGQVLAHPELCPTRPDDCAKEAMTSARNTAIRQISRSIDKSMMYTTRYQTGLRKSIIKDITIEGAVTMTRAMASACYQAELFADGVYHNKIKCMADMASSNRYAAPTNYGAAGSLLSDLNAGLAQSFGGATEYIGAGLGNYMGRVRQSVQYDGGRSQIGDDGVYLGYE